MSSIEEDNCRLTALNMPARAQERTSGDEFTSCSNFKDSTLAPVKSTGCTLQRLPPEVRAMIFTLAIEDHFTNRPEDRELLHVGCTEPWGCTTTDKCSVTYKEPVSGLGLQGLPALERALIPETKLYREFFALRIQKSIISLRPSMTFDWEHEFPVISSDFDGGFECLFIDEPMPHPSDYPNSHWYPEIFEAKFYPSMFLHQETGDYRGWTFEYPDIGHFSPLLKSSIRALNVFTHSPAEFFLYWELDLDGSKLMSATAATLRSGADLLPNIKLLEIQFLDSDSIHVGDYFFEGGWHDVKPNQGVLWHALRDFLERLNIEDLTFRDFYKPDLTPFTTPSGSPDDRYGIIGAEAEAGLGRSGDWTRTQIKPNPNNPLGGLWEMKMVWKAARGDKLKWAGPVRAHEGEAYPEPV